MIRNAQCVRDVRSTRGSRAGHTIEQSIGCRATKTCTRNCHSLCYASEMKNLSAELGGVGGGEAMSLIRAAARNEFACLHVLQGGEPLKARWQQVYCRSPGLGRSGSRGMDGGPNDRLATVRTKLLRVIAILRQRLQADERERATPPPRREEAGRSRRFPTEPAQAPDSRHDASSGPEPPPEVPPKAG